MVIAEAKTLLASHNSLSPKLGKNNNKVNPLRDDEMQYNGHFPNDSSVIKAAGIITHRPQLDKVSGLGNLGPPQG